MAARIMLAVRRLSTFRVQAVHIDFPGLRRRAATGGFQYLARDADVDF